MGRATIWALFLHCLAEVVRVDPYMKMSHASKFATIVMREVAPHIVVVMRWADDMQYPVASGGLVAGRRPCGGAAAVAFAFGGPSLVVGLCDCDGVILHDRPWLEICVMRPCAERSKGIQDQGDPAVLGQGHASRVPTRYCRWLANMPATNHFRLTYLWLLRLVGVVAVRQLPDGKSAVSQQCLRNVLGNVLLRVTLGLLVWMCARKTHRASRSGRLRRLVAVVLVLAFSSLSAV